MSKFDFIKKEAIEKRIDITSQTSLLLIDTIKYLKQVENFNKLSEEDFKKLEEANEVLVRAMENMEDELEEE